MDARMQNIEQRLQNVDELQETVLGLRHEIQNLGRVFRQEFQTMAQVICNNENRAFRGEVNKLCEARNIAKRLDLTHLRQTGTLAEFNIKFDTLVARLDLSEEYLVDVYVGALKEEIADSVLMFDPQTLVEARRLARVQEIAINHRMSKKMIPSIKKVPQEHVMIQEGCDGDFVTDQDSFIDIESTSTLNFKTHGSVANRSYASLFSSNIEVGYVEITSGVNGTRCLDSGGGVQERNRHRESDGGRLQETFDQDPRFCSKQRLCPSILSKSEAGCVENSVGNARKVYPIPSLLGSISSFPFFAPGCRMFSPLEPITASLPSMPMSLQVEQQQRVQMPRNEQMGCSQAGLHNTPSSPAPSISTALSTQAIVILLLPLSSFSSLISLFQSLVQGTLQSEDNAQTSKNTIQFAECARELMWLQKSQFEKSNSQLASIFSQFQQYFRDYIGICNTQWAYGLGWDSKEDSPISLQWCFTIPLGVNNDGLFQKWASFLNFSPTRILMLEWFKGELITMLFGRGCSRKKRKK